MPDALTFRALRLALHGPGGYRTINTVEDAAEALLTRWPVKDGEALLTAGETILCALKGEKTPEEARRAIIAAAYEAGISVIE